MKVPFTAVDWTAAKLPKVYVVYTYQKGPKKEREMAKRKKKKKKRVAYVITTKRFHIADWSQAADFQPIGGSYIWARPRQEFLFLETRLRFCKLMGPCQGARSFFPLLLIYYLPVFLMFRRIKKP